MLKSCLWEQVLSQNLQVALLDFYCNQLGINNLFNQFFKDFFSVTTLHTQKKVFNVWHLQGHALYFNNLSCTQHCGF